jgi:hypothetical protein
MKKPAQHCLLPLVLLFLMGSAFAQQCEKSHKDGDCQMVQERGFKSLSQSGGYYLSTQDSLELNVVFYGQKDYILSFCTEKELYPIHYKIYETDSKTLLYDNQDDRFIETLEMGMDVTRKLTFRIKVLANLAGEEVSGEGSGCLGVFIQYKNYPNK